MIEPVRSRCLCIRVAAPTSPQVQRMLAYVAKKEILKLPDALSLRVAQVRLRLTKAIGRILHMIMLCILRRNRT